MHLHMQVLLPKHFRLRDFHSGSLYRLRTNIQQLRVLQDSQSHAEEQEDVLPTVFYLQGGVQTVCKYARTGTRNSP